MVRRVVCMLLAGWLLSAPAWGELLKVTLPRPFRGDESLADYDLAVLNRALQTTRRDFGPYELKLSAQQLPDLRAFEEVSRGGGEPNVIAWRDNIDLRQRFRVVPFPYDRGAMSLFIPVVRATDMDRLATVQQLQELKAWKISYGSRVRGATTRTLAQLGYRFEDADSPQVAAQMLAARRFDLLVLPANQAWTVWQLIQHDNPSLALDGRLLVATSGARVFAVSSGPAGEKLHARLMTGLSRAWKDGSLEKLFQQYIGKSFTPLGLSGRRVLRWDDPNAPTYGRFDSVLLFR